MSTPCGQRLRTTRLSVLRGIHPDAELLRQVGTQIVGRTAELFPQRPPAALGVPASPRPLPACCLLSFLYNRHFCDAAYIFLKEEVTKLGFRNLCRTEHTILSVKINFDR